MTLSEFLDFLQSISFKDSCDLQSVISITHAQYPLLFFSQLYTRLKKQGHVCEALDMATLDEASIKSMLATSFLGMKKIFLLQHLHTLDAKTKHKWHTYLSSYAGPHTLIIFFLDSEVPKEMQGLRVTIPQTLDKPLCKKIIEFFGYQFNEKMRYFVDELIAKRPAISLDMFCVCIAYAVVAGKGIDTFLFEWLDELAPREESLFTLSQHFFAKDMRAFFALWMVLKEIYPPQFWISFWSEQVWRAAFYVQLQKSNQLAEAKRTSFKLPFSLTQRHWRSYEVHELQKAHDALYRIDYALKNGGVPYMLELWLVQFLSHSFKNV